MSRVGSLVRVALPSIPVVNRLPGVRKGRVTDFTEITVQGTPQPIDPAHVARYAKVCGFAPADTLPLTYPHMVAFGQQTEIMASPEFPWAAMGSVHLENTITQHRRIALTETLTSAVTVGTPRPHAKGTVLDFVTSVESGEEVVWEEVSSYLFRGRGSEEAPAGMQFSDVPEGRATWSLPDDLGRRYGMVSGDVNPIHLHPLTAKALGFTRHIAHGMWTKARCVAGIDNRLPDAVEVRVAFKKPVFLPSTVAFGLAGDRSAWRFALTNPKDGSPHLMGDTRAL